MMYGCILDNEGEILLRQNIPTQPSRFLKLIGPYREDIVVGDPNGGSERDTALFSSVLFLLSFFLFLPRLNRRVRLAAP
jgi:hypothetical protein